MKQEVILIEANKFSPENLLMLLQQRGKIDSEPNVLERIEQYSNNPLHLLMLATVDEVLAGYIWIQNYGPHLRVGKSTARLHDIFVLDEFRGRGIATQLFNYGKKWSEENKVSYLQWQADKDAIPFYTKLGLIGDTKSDLEESPFYEIEFD